MKLALACLEEKSTSVKSESVSVLVQSVYSFWMVANISLRWNVKVLRTRVLRYWSFVFGEMPFLSSLSGKFMSVSSWTKPSKTLKLQKMWLWNFLWTMVILYMSLRKIFIQFYLITSCILRTQLSCASRLHEKWFGRYSTSSLSLKTSLIQAKARRNDDTVPGWSHCGEKWRIVGKAEPSYLSDWSIS